MPHGVNTCHGVPLGRAICVRILHVDVSVSVRFVDNLFVRIPPYALLVTLWGGVGVGLVIMLPFGAVLCVSFAHG